MTYQSPRWGYTPVDIVRLSKPGVTEADAEAAQKYEDEWGDCAYLDRVVAVAELLAAERLRIVAQYEKWQTRGDDGWTELANLRAVTKELKK